VQACLPMVFSTYREKQKEYNMKKVLIVATILFTTALMVCGTFYPNNPLMWLAGTTMPFEATRAVLVVLLLVLLFSHPPRALYVRYTIGAVSLMLFVGVAVLVENFQINLIDMIDLLEIAVIFAIEALESPREVMPVAKKSRQLAMAK